LEIMELSYLIPPGIILGFSILMGAYDMFFWFFLGILMSISTAVVAYLYSKNMIERYDGPLNSAYIWTDDTSTKKTISTPLPTIRHPDIQIQRTAFPEGVIPTQEERPLDENASSERLPLPVGAPISDSERLLPGAPTSGSEKHPESTERINSYNEIPHIINLFNRTGVVSSTVSPSEMDILLASVETSRQQIETITPPAISSSQDVRSTFGSLTQSIRRPISGSTYTGGYEYGGKYANLESFSRKRTQNKGLLFSLSSEICNRSYVEASDIVQKSGYQLHVLYVGLSNKMPRAGGELSTVIGVRIKDPDFKDGVPSKHAIITEVVDIGGVDEDDMGMIKL
jgi:hypothetical protein